MSWKNPGKVRTRTYGTKSPSRSSLIGVPLNVHCQHPPWSPVSIGKPAPKIHQWTIYFCRWGFGWVDKAQCFRSARRFDAVGSSPEFSRVFSRHLASGHLNLSSSSHVLRCRTQANSSHFNHSAEPAIRSSSIRTEDPACVNYVDVFTVWSVFLRMSIVNILRGLPCRLESLRLKFTNEPSTFVDGDLAESIKLSASDRLGDLVP